MTPADSIGTAVRVYDSLRTAHLERFAVMEPALVLYRGTRYDFDPTVGAGRARLQRASRLGVLRALFGRSVRRVELNEPLMTGCWFDLVMHIAVLRLCGALRRRRVQIGAYCIGLTDPTEKLHIRRRVPTPLARAWSVLVLRVILHGMDRLAIGTEGSWDLLASYVGRPALENRAKLFPALPAPCTCSPGEHRMEAEVLFLGAFVERKGIVQLMQAWEMLTADADMRLRLIGKGALSDHVQRWSTGMPRVSVEIDPSRDVIHAALRRAHVLVLPSQRQGYWREQVGLPIVEALAHGCEVVTTAETGLAMWLQQHGHTVIDAASDPKVLAEAIVRARAKRRTAERVTLDLPIEDSRRTADRWLLGREG